MPLLTFSCPKCGRQFEEFANAEKLADMRCPDCGEAAEREYSGKVYGGTPKQSAAMPGCGAGCVSCPHAQLH